MGVRRLCTRAGCRKTIPDREKYRDDCSQCKQAAKRGSKMQSRDRAAFYGTAQWQALALSVKAKSVFCETCGDTWATAAHHILPAKIFPEFRFSKTNLAAICDRCHAQERAKEARTYKQFEDDPDQLRKELIEDALRTRPELRELLRA